MTPALSVRTYLSGTNTTEDIIVNPFRKPPSSFVHGQSFAPFFCVALTLGEYVCGLTAQGPLLLYRRVKACLFLYVCVCMFLPLCVCLHLDVVLASCRWCYHIGLGTPSLSGSHASHPIVHYAYHVCVCVHQRRGCHLLVCQVFKEVAIVLHVCCVFPTTEASGGRKPGRASCPFSMEVLG